MTFLRFIIRLLSTIHPKLAMHVVRFLSSFPQHLAKRDIDLQLMNSAKLIRYQDRGEKTALSWGQGPLVVLIHGWEGRATQMGLLAQHLAKQGYQAVALDLTAHGDSSGKSSGFNVFMDDIEGLLKHLGQSPYAMIGHSAGGLCLMASRHLRQVQAQRFITINSPTYPFPLIEHVRKLLRLEDKVIEQVKGKIAQDFDTHWPSLSSGQFYQPCHPQEQYLAIADEDDDMVPHKEADRGAQLFEDGQVFKSQGHGHIKILWQQEMHEQIAEFLTTAKRTQQQAI